MSAFDSCWAGEYGDEYSEGGYSEHQHPAHQVSHANQSSRTQSFDGHEPPDGPQKLLFANQGSREADKDSNYEQGSVGGPQDTNAFTWEIDTKSGALFSSPRSVSMKSALDHEGRFQNQTSLPDEILEFKEALHRQASATSPSEQPAKQLKASELSKGQDFEAIYPLDEVGETRSREIIKEFEAGEPPEVSTAVTPEVVVSKLKDTYEARRSQRESYLHLIGFLAFIGLYFLILLLQSTPGEEYRNRQGMYENVVPKEDEDGEPTEFFMETDEIYDWLRQIIQDSWLDAPCGDTLCEDPFEFPAFSHLGCQADCNVANGTNFTVVLEPRFVRSYEEEALVEVSYNLCTDDIEPVCWWSENQLFDYNFATVRHDNLSLPDATWILTVYNLTAYKGLVMGSLAESFAETSRSDDEEHTYHRLRALQAQTPPEARILSRRGARFKAGRRHQRRLSEDAKRVTERRLTDTETNASEVASGSVWSVWRKELADSQIEGIVVESVEYCQNALLKIMDTFSTAEYDCEIDWGGEGQYSLCCPDYKELLIGNCWCTVVATDDYFDNFDAHLMHMAYFNADRCNNYDPDEYPLLIRGKECPIIPEVIEVEDMSGPLALNTVACYWEFETLYGNFTSYELGETPFTVDCFNETSYADMLDTPECCEMIRPAVESYNCTCMSCEELGSIGSKFFMHLIVDLAIDCGFQLQGVHPDCDYDHAPQCKVSPNSIYYPKNFTNAARSNKQWNTRQEVMESAEWEPVMYSFGKDTNMTELFAKDGDYETLSTCAVPNQEIPFECQSHLDYLCIFVQNAEYDEDYCNDEQLPYMLCDADITSKCGGMAMDFCEGDLICGHEDCTYAEFASIVINNNVAPCYGDDAEAVCADFTVRCQNDIQVYHDRLVECATANSSTCTQGHNVAKFFSTDMYYCARFLDWDVVDPGAENYPNCERILYSVRQLDARFNFAVGAQNITDVDFCNKTSQHASCTAIDGIVDYRFTDQYTLPAYTLSDGCRTHNDCPYGYFCALMKTDGTTDSLCMPCWWCEGCTNYTELGIVGDARFEHRDHPPWLLYPAEPTCGHCPCSPLECAPGCTNAMLNNGLCDEACMNEECQYDSFACPYDFPATQGALACPTATPQVVRGKNVGLERYYSSYLVQLCCDPYYDDSENNVTIAEITIETYPDQRHWPRGWDNNVDQNSFELVQKINRLNRLLAGMVIQVHRGKYQTCPTDEFAKLYDICLPTTGLTAGSALTDPYGTDGVFQVGDDFYNEDVAKSQHYYYPDDSDLNPFGVPYGFRSFDMGGSYATYPVVIDINLSARRAQEMVDYLQACNYIESNTVQISVQLLTYNPGNPFFANALFSIKLGKDGTWRIKTDVRALNTQWLETWGDYARCVLEFVFVCVYLKTTFSEIRELMQVYRDEGSVKPYFSDICNVIDWVAIIMITCAVSTYLWLLALFSHFDIESRYHIYESLSGTNSTGGHVNWLELHDEGENLSILAGKLNEFNNLLLFKTWYKFLTGIVVIANLLRVLKLMDFHPDIGMVTRTMREAGTDLINFIGLLLIILSIYAFMGYIVFGSVSSYFYRLDYSLLSCFVMMMGETEFSEDIRTLGGSVEQSIGLIFFYSFMMLVFLFLVSALLGIIVSAMDRVKQLNGNASSVKADLFSDLGELVRHLLEHCLILARRKWNEADHHRFPMHATITENDVYNQIAKWDAATGGGISQEEQDEAEKSKATPAEHVLPIDDRLYSKEEVQTILLSAASEYGITVLRDNERKRNTELTDEEFGIIDSGLWEKSSADTAGALADEIKVNALTMKILSQIGMEESKVPHEDAKPSVDDDTPIVSESWVDSPVNDRTLTGTGVPCEDAKPSVDDNTPAVSESWVDNPVNDRTLTGTGGNSVLALEEIAATCTEQAVNGHHLQDSRNSNTTALEVEDQKLPTSSGNGPEQSCEPVEDDLGGFSWRLWSRF
ncbi:hypothetical protein CYMTET_39671 [Cymbomonas tetramitiformis]|uniref:Polycystin cation channel PKD1/PKD2 domain-containing protein n=1 Tax=Cymbomonas tetramitiformis TaxID=36881 RepID=A0AAE0CAP1_9CHLO|nr:hypothetical protein CYMTET_39671 [Cymbomonas tetramitiformis]